MLHIVFFLSCRDQKSIHLFSAILLIPFLLYPNMQSFSCFASQIISWSPCCLVLLFLKNMLSRPPYMMAQNRYNPQSLPEKLFGSVYFDWLGCLTALEQITEAIASSTCVKWDAPALFWATHSFHHSSQNISLVNMPIVFCFNNSNSLWFLSKLILYAAPTRWLTCRGAEPEIKIQKSVYSRSSGAVVKSPEFILPCFLISDLTLLSFVVLKQDVKTGGTIAA